MSENLNAAHWVRRMVVIAMPLLISFSWITWVVGPAYPSYEYSKPDFSPDLDGMMRPVIAER